MNFHWGKHRDIGYWPVSMIDTIKGTVVPVVKIGYNPRHLPVAKDTSIEIFLTWYTHEDSEYFFTKWRQG
jgi:hypothetical protein